MRGWYNILTLDVGDFEWSRESSDSYEAVPKRNDGFPDRRYKAARKWHAYMADQQAKATAAYIADRPFRAEEFRL